MAAAWIFIISIIVYRKIEEKQEEKKRRRISLKLAETTAQYPIPPPYHCPTEYFTIGTILMDFKNDIPRFLRLQTVEMSGRAFVLSRCIHYFGFFSHFFPFLLQQQVQACQAEPPGQTFRPPLSQFRGFKIDLLELYEIGRSPDLRAPKLQKGRSGSQPGWRENEKRTAGATWAVFSFSSFHFQPSFIQPAPSKQISRPNFGILKHQNPPTNVSDIQ